MLLLSIAALVAFLVWQWSVRRSFSPSDPAAREHLDRLLAAADVLSWNDAEVRRRVELSASDPEQYFERHGDAFGAPSEVWPYAVFCEELIQRGLAVRGADHDAPTLDLCRRFDPILARCGLSGFDWSALRSVGSGDSVESFLSEVAVALRSNGLALVHIHDGSINLIVTAHPEARFAAIDGTLGPKNAYVIRSWPTGAAPL